MTGLRLLYGGMEFLCSIPCQVFVLLYNQNEHYHGYVKRLQVEFGKNRKILDSFPLFSTHLEFIFFNLRSGLKAVDTHCSLKEFVKR